jgi:hypothetical protein
MSLVKLASMPDTALSAPLQSPSLIDSIDPSPLQIQDALTQLFIHGDLKLAGSFKNAVIDKLYEGIKKTRTYPRECLRRVYILTDEKSPLRKLFVDSAIWCDSPSNLARLVKSGPEGFGAAMVARQAELMRIHHYNAEKSVLDRCYKAKCDYHIYDDETRCDTKVRRPL